MWRNCVWILLGVTAVVALAIGSQQKSGPQTAAQRAAALDTQLRCPSCDDESVANSSAATAVAIKQLVLEETESGVPQSQIVAYLQSRYPGIVLRPPASGVESVVWFAPLLGFVVAIGAIGTLFWRRQRARGPTPLGEDDRKLVAEALRATRSGAPT